MAEFGKKIIDNGLVVASWVAVTSTIAGGSYFASRTITNLQAEVKLAKEELRRVEEVANTELRRVEEVANSKLRRQEEMANVKLMRATAELKTAVEKARKETADRFLQLGFTEEYQRYQRRLSLGRENDEA